MTEPVRYGIVGVAGIGETHADALERVPGVDLVACADLNRAAAESFAAERGCRAYTDPTAMIRDAAVDAVSVCTPSGTHAEVSIECVETGAHVLCEKPLDVYGVRIDAMIDAADAAGVTLAGVFQRRAYPCHQRARRAVADGDLGRMVLGTATVKWHRPQSYYDSAAWRGTREMDGGCLLNQAIHVIDLLQWIGGGVSGLYARTDTLAREMECEDSAAVLLEFENGAPGTIEATTATQGGTSRLEINGTAGSYNDTEFSMGEGIPAIDAGGPLEWGVAHTEVVRDFVESVRDGRAPMVPAREARTAVDLVLAIYESAAREAWIDFDAFRAGDYE
ncbi:Gfo/Idh/MocA family protein [Natronobiforma cellulositropha]|uniref:Gfo/Idh/MocA family protein n=1 Tax=Natronobiforma cellulositropha TaxID=1679076 RepID=UPI0021D5AF5E|nr:Gfo/Idh/MocA family oxidoreductase [Natronobiforma cellulositropha]